MKEFFLLARKTLLCALPTCRFWLSKGDTFLNLTKFARKKINFVNFIALKNQKFFNNYLSSSYNNRNPIKARSESSKGNK